MNIGQKVKTPDGGIETIKDLKADLVVTEESSKTGTWYSNTDLIPVYFSESLKKYVACQEDAR